MLHFHRFWVFLVLRPNPILHFAPFLPTDFFPCLNPIFKNGSFLSVVALVSVTLLDSNPSPLPRTTTELPERQQRRGAETISEGRRRLHKNTAHAHIWGSSCPFSRKEAEGPKVGFRCLGCFGRVLVVFWVF